MSHTTKSSNIKPIGLWLLQCMMWKTGVAERYFESLQNIEDDGENDNEGGDKTQNKDDDNEFL